MNSGAHANPNVIMCATLFEGMEATKFTSACNAFRWYTATLNVARLQGWACPSVCNAFIMPPASQSVCKASQGNGSFVMCYVLVRLCCQQLCLLTRCMLKPFINDCVWLRRSGERGTHSDLIFCVARGLEANSDVEIKAPWRPPALYSSTLRPLLFSLATWSLCWTSCSNTGRTKTRLQTSNDNNFVWALHLTGLVV